MGHKINRDPAVISYTMSRIRSKGTSIEKAMEYGLRGMGLRYRKNYKLILGSPDFVFLRAKVAVFCDGSFWHGRDWKMRKDKITSNRKYWLKKIRGNMLRDIKVNSGLKQAGWKVMRFWDIDINNKLSKCLTKVQNTVIKRAVI